MFWIPKGVQFARQDFDFSSRAEEEEPISQVVSFFRMPTGEWGENGLFLFEKRKREGKQSCAVLMKTGLKKISPRFPSFPLATCFTRQQAHLHIFLFSLSLSSLLPCGDGEWDDDTQTD